MSSSKDDKEPTEFEGAAPEARLKRFLDIPKAAEMAGYSPRHFRRIIEEDRIPIVQIGRKFFILDRDFQNWKEANKNLKREGSSRLQLDTVVGWHGNRFKP